MHFDYFIVKYYLEFNEVTNVIEIYKMYVCI